MSLQIIIYKFVIHKINYLRAYMTNFNQFAKRAYSAPAADVSEVLEDVMICTSGGTEDWICDDESLDF